MGIVQQIDNYNTFLLENQFDEEGVVEDLENRDKSRLELVKKEEKTKKI